MKAVLITYDQAHHERILRLLDHLNCRGFTCWPQVQGRGTKTGEPHYGSHAWPSMSMAIITIVADDLAATIMDRLHEMDEETPRLGLRAFAWTIDATI